VTKAVSVVICACFAFGDIFAQQWPEGKEGRMAGQPELLSVPARPGLLFYLSGSKGFTADFAAGGQVLPNFLKDVKIIPDGATSPGFRAENSQLLTYWAPGNIYAQRGTISFCWRSRFPVGTTPFPVFRVGYADHSSWDMVWLRIDYNGSGFDAIVTDIGLSRTRVSCYMDKFPGPEEWIHLTLAWDETEGIRFYVNGKLAAVQTSTGSVYDSGLDQFGPHSRIISPYQVQSEYNFKRGGDLDELRVYDRMLTDEIIADLSKNITPETLPPFKRDLAERRWRDEWWLRNGWNLPNQPPPLLPSDKTAVRKVEIHDAYDLKRWYWKANDGIRETTWPGVYNMSRLPGRYDYFVLPDWDCYSGSGQSVRFTMPDEKWNHAEIWGKAWGQVTLESDYQRDFTFGVRTRDQIKSWHCLAEPQTGGKIRFDNALIEEPIGSFDVYNVEKGNAPEGTKSEIFTVSIAPREPGKKALEDLASFICGRYPADEQNMMVGIPGGINEREKYELVPGNSYPFIHILIPYSDQKDSGLDGVEIQFPKLNVTPTHSGLFPVNIRVKDPLWQMRDLADFSFSVKPGDSPDLWIDTRDRILPKGHALYITVAGAGSDLTPELLKGTIVRLVYKSADKARPEHEMDRFTQVRDLYAHIVEERPRSPRFNLYNRFIADCRDLLSVNPDNWLAKTYLYALTQSGKPEYKISECPEGVPEWAFLQIEYLRHLEKIISFYIDRRQIANGEFGGGLSDDGDLTNNWPPAALMGIGPEKLLNSLRLHMAAYYDQERPATDAGLRQRSLPLFTNGLATIFTDELHALEDGIQVVSQLQLLDYGNPLYIERGMETADRLLNDITQINSAGHRHFRTRYYSGTKIATEDPWQLSVNHSYHVLQSAYLIARYNGNEKLCRMITELADGLLEHRENGKWNTEIDFMTDSGSTDSGLGSASFPWPLFIAAYNLTGDKKYIEVLPERNLYTREFNPEKLARRYRDDITNLGIREYINTEGSIWIDRVGPFTSAIQKDRLGGIALARISALYPEHFVSWKFKPPSNYESTAIYLPEAGPSEISIIAYNLDHVAVKAEMKVWDIKPGRWKMRQGLDANGDMVIDGNATEAIIDLERGNSVDLTFEPARYNIVTLELIAPEGKDVAKLPDLGIGPNDLKINGNSVIVRIHNLGNVSASESKVEIRDSKGNLAATAQIPAIEAPADLKPRWTDIQIKVTEGTDLSGGSVRIDPEFKTAQITRINDFLKW
jgi:hypothetical protein